MSDFVEFMTARLDEDEAAANAANTDQARTPWGDRTIPPTPVEQWGDMVDGYLGGSIGAHCARWGPLRALAEVKAKRDVLARHEPYRFKHGLMCQQCACLDCVAEEWPCSDLRALAAVYAGHPDYRQEWVP